VEVGLAGLIEPPDEALYWTPLRLELLQWFRERVPGFAEGYEAAARLVHEPTFPARVNLVCHLVRDIYRDLPRALRDTSEKNRGVDVYPALVAKLRDVWDANPAVEDAVSIDVGRLVSAQAYNAAERLVEASRTVKEQASVGTRLARALFRAVERPEGMPIPGWIFSAFDEEYDFFVGRAHLRPTGMPAGDGLLVHFESFERAFHSIVGPYFKGKEELDAILAETNRRAD
jgi:hypothetical protein